MQMDWYNIWLNALDNFRRLYQGKDIVEIIEVKVLQVYHSSDVSTYRKVYLITKIFALRFFPKFSFFDPVFLVTKREGSRPEAPSREGIKICRLQWFSSRMSH